MEVAVEEDVVQLNRHKLDVAAYYRMVEVGILREGEQVELIDGEIIDMAPIGVGHASIVTRINRALVRACGDQALVSVQNPVRLDDYNEPQPDFLVLKPRADFYGSEHPGPSDVHLLIEVADSSLPYDRAVKVPLYGRFGIPEIWIVDVKRRVVRSFRNPAAGRYSLDEPHQSGEALHLAAAPDIVVAVQDLVG